MSRIQAPAKPSAKSRTLLDSVEKKLGLVPNLLKSLAHSPAALSGYINFSGALAQGELSLELSEQIALTVAGLNECDYCASAHTYLGKDAGVQEAELTCNLRGQSTDPKTQTALRFARNIVESRGKVEDADLLAVRDAGFSEAEIVEIIAHAGLNTFTNFFNSVAETDIDFPRIETHTIVQSA